MVNVCLEYDNERIRKMNSKLLKIFVIAFTTLFLNTQAFACGSGAQKDQDRGKTDLDKSSMGSSDQSFSTDRNMEMDQGGYDNNKSMDRSDQSKTDQFNKEQQDQLDR